ncbi:hypothetical protein [Halomontanus rarus]|uniref:hypothetical protein n=1 Tax=Halomontanus rarus TaxID=3034020 RepID=UPI0023E7C27E|nr:hypothetical protein [Halovivax sp. TS33]
MLDRVSELDSHTLWRLFVGSSVGIGIVAAYVVTGELLASLVLGWLFAILVAVGFTLVINGGRRVQARLSGGRAD